MDTQTTDDVVLLAEYGSRAYGVATENSDHDLMGVYVESRDQTYGLEVANTRASSLGRRSGAGDTDTTVHPLRKFVSLAAKGNPTVLTLLWSPPELVSVCTAAGRLLMDRRSLFVSKSVVTAHLGYAASQSKKLSTGKGGHANRPELVEQFGFDTKAAMHLLRLLLQCGDLLRDGDFSLPMRSGDVELLRSVRRGDVPLDVVLRLAGEYSDEARRLESESLLPQRPDASAVNQLLFDVRMAASVGASGASR